MEKSQQNFKISKLEDYVGSSCVVKASPLDGVGNKFNKFFI